MKVKMKAYEYKALMYSKKFINWEFQIIAKDAYLAGLKDTKSEEEIEVELKDGEHQLIDEIRAK